MRERKRALYVIYMQQQQQQRNSITIRKCANKRVLSQKSNLTFVAILSFVSAPEWCAAQKWISVYSLFGLSHSTWVASTDKRTILTEGDRKKCYLYWHRSSIFRWILLGNFRDFDLDNKFKIWKYFFRVWNWNTQYV